MIPDDVLLPAGARLIHVGAHKTGTTAVQGAFHQVRERLPEHGVSFYGPAPGSTYLEGALAVTGRKAQLGKPVPGMEHWTALTAAVAAEGDRRVLVSSAFFGDGDEAATARVVEGLGGPRLRVIVTLRPLARILPSQWQQYVQNGLRLRYPEWLDSMLNKPREEVPMPSFWQRHRHDELIGRWAAAAGPGNVTAVVIDESDRLMLPRLFEKMLDLPDGLLELVNSAANRSLMLGEAELLRLLNEEASQRDWPEQVYARLLRAGAIRYLKNDYQPAPGEQRIITPPWALKRAAEIGAEMAAGISALGVRVIGDPGTLGTTPAGADMGPDSAEPEPVVASAAAAQAVLGAIIASKLPEQQAGKAGKPRPAPVEDRQVREVDAKTLARVLASRGRRRVSRALRRPA
jgi:hypothetical protein